MRAQTGLDGVDQQQGTVCGGQLAGHGIEFRRHRTARIAFAHDRLEEHRFDVPAVAIGIGEGLFEGIDGVGLDGDQLVFMVFPAGQVFGIGLARGIGIQAGQFGASVEGALHGDALDAFSGVTAARIGHQLGVGVGDAPGQGHRFRTRVQGQEFGEGTAAAAVADFGAQGLDHAQLGKTRRHDVGHHLRFGHGFNDRLRRVAETQHAVAAGIMQHPAFEGDDPRAAGGDGHVGVDGVIRVEIDEAGLSGIDLSLLVGIDQFRKFRGQSRVGLGGTTGGGQQIRVLGRETQQGGVIQALGTDHAGMAA